MDALKANDKNAFEMIFRNWYKPLCSFACSFVSDKAEAEEIVQSAFVNFWEKRFDITIESSLKSYLFRSVRNSCLNSIKHEKVKRQHVRHSLATVDSQSEKGGAGLIASELETRIAGAMSKLPEQCGIVFHLSRFEDMRYLEIAEHLGISVKTVENHMGKALRIMREELREYLVVALLILMEQALTQMPEFLIVG